jgi:thiol-disulfide isomerase/thioredoxin
VTWVKGEAVPAFESGEIYVLDFWATWCGPCKASIPHVNELAQTRRKDQVSVIGVAIWPSPTMVPTVDFVADKGEKMDYKIAADIDGATADTYMKASGQNGIPTAMIIDREGTVAWIGHPMLGLEEALDEVIAGTFDMLAAREARAEKRLADEAQAAARAAAKPLALELEKATEAGEWADVVDLAGRIAAMHESLVSFRLRQYQGLAQVLSDDGQAARFGRDLVVGAFQEEANLLNGLAWWIVDPETEVKDSQRDLDLAMLAIVRANALTEHGNASIVDTLARVHFLKGDLAKAIEVQEHAIGLAGDNEAAVSSLTETLETYRKAIAKR